MKIAIGADHRGIELKDYIKKFLKAKGINYKDFGTMSENSVDYPDIAIPLAEAVASGEYDFGILICFTGEGMTITANKVAGIRAAYIIEPIFAEMSKRHNNANILCFPGGFIKGEVAVASIERFLKSEFEAGRHERRVEKIMQYEASR